MELLAEEQIAGGFLFQDAALAHKLVIIMRVKFVFGEDLIVAEIVKILFVEGIGAGSFRHLNIWRSIFKIVLICRVL